MNDPTLKLAPEPPPTYLTMQEAATLARCNERTIRRAVSAGGLRAFRPAHRVLIREDDVRAWVESRAAVETKRQRPRQRRGRSAPGSVAALRQIEERLGR